MAGINDGRPDEKQQDLKAADSKKAHCETASPIGGKQEEHTIYRSVGHISANGVKFKKKLPIAVDVAAGILILLLVVAILVGSYMLFVYYADDYDSVSVIYTVAFEATDDVELFVAMKDKSVFVDAADNTVYFGKVTEVNIEKTGAVEDNGRMILTIKADAKFKKSEGYSIGDIRLAVGSTLTLRCGESSTDVTVVGLVSEEK